MFLQFVYDYYENQFNLCLCPYNLLYVHKKTRQTSNEFNGKHKGISRKPMDQNSEEHDRLRNTFSVTCSSTSAEMKSEPKYHRK